MPISDNLDAVQKAILAIHRDEFGESPSPMKLQKLCYYAQGYLLAEGAELFPEDFQAWQHGPVIPDLYQKYRDFSWHAIDAPVDAAAIDGGVRDAIVDIVKAYGRYDGAALSTMTHREAPWHNARGDLPESDGSTAVITKDAIQNFFAEKLRVHGEGR